MIEDATMTYVRTFMPLSVSYSRLRSSPSIRTWAPFLKPAAYSPSFGPCLDALPFGAFLALVTFQLRRFGGDRECSDGFTGRGIAGFWIAAEEKPWPRAATADDEKKRGFEKLSHNECAKEKRP